jgi:ribosomal protein S12
MFVDFWQKQGQRDGRLSRKGGPGRHGFVERQWDALFAITQEMRQMQIERHNAVWSLTTPLCRAFKARFPKLKNKALRRALKRVAPDLVMVTQKAKKPIPRARKLLRVRLARRRLTITSWRCAFIFDETSINVSELLGRGVRLAAFTDSPGYEDARRPREDSRVPHKDKEDDVPNIILNVLLGLSPLAGAGPMCWLTGTTGQKTRFKVSTRERVRVMKGGGGAQSTGQHGPPRGLVILA